MYYTQRYIILNKFYSENLIYTNQMNTHTVRTFCSAYFFQSLQGWDRCLRRELLWQLPSFQSLCSGLECLHPLLLEQILMPSAGQGVVF